MKHQQKLFLQRQCLQLAQRGKSQQEILEKVIPLATTEPTAESILRKNQQLLPALEQAELIDIDPDLLEKLKASESRGEFKPRLGSLFGGNELTDSTIKLMTTRLTLNLSYALWLIFVAVITFNTISTKVIGNFQDMFATFGASLPALTESLFAWEQSLFSPTRIILLLGLLIIALLYSCRKITPENIIHSKLQHVPFLKQVIHYCNAANWLKNLRMMVDGGLPVSRARDILGPAPKSLAQLAPECEPQIKSADALGNGEAEISHQIDQLAFHSELVVSRASHRFTASVFALIFAYISYVIIASYLPIFQLGNVN